MAITLDTAITLSGGVQFDMSKDQDGQLLLSITLPNAQAVSIPVVKNDIYLISRKANQVFVALNS